MKNLIMVALMTMVAFPVYAAKDLDADGVRNCMRLSDDLESSGNKIDNMQSKLDRLGSRHNGLKMQATVNESAMMMAETNARWNGNWNYYNSLVQKQNNFVWQEDNLVREFNNLNGRINRKVDNHNSRNDRYKRKCNRVSVKQSILNDVCDSSNKFCRAFK